MPPIPLRSTRRSRLLATIGLAVGVSTCTAPVDVSREYGVTLQTDAPLVYRGTGIGAYATLWHYIGTDSVPVPNVALVWSGGGDQIQIDPQPNGYASIYGIARGAAWVSVEAPAFAGAGSAGTEIRVADQVELDTVFPDTVAWGGRLTLHGVRVGSPNDVTVRLNGVNLIPDTLSLIGDASQVESMGYFVPGGATSGLLVVTGFGLIATDSTPITVLPHELYEPNDQAPTVVQLDTAQPYPASTDPPSPGHPEIRFFDPALQYEAPPGTDSITTDWYHFVSATGTAQPWTFVFRSGATPHRGAFGVPATAHGSVPIFDDGAFGYDFDAHRLISRCRGTDVAFGTDSAVDSLVLSLQSLPASGIDFVEYTSEAGSYALGVSTGYRVPVTSGPPIGPDKFEDNDFCEQADANFAIDSLKIDLGQAAFSDTLTIDTPYEVDWYRFHVATAGPVHIATAHRTDFADATLHLYLLQQADLAPVDSVVGGATADQQLSDALAAGDYYLIVVNADGRTTRYGLCIAAGATCVQPPDPAAPPRGVSRR